MDNVAGPPVEGDNFFGREAEVDRLWNLLDEHDVLLLGPRRVGKTSVARAVMQRARQAGWHAVETNVAAGVDEKAFLDKLILDVQAQQGSLLSQAHVWLRDGLNDAKQRLKSLKIQVAGGSFSVELASQQTADWTLPASELLCLLKSTREPWLIYIDELPILLYNLLRHDPGTGVARVRRFLDWLRNDVCNLPGTSKVHWLISGSVGLDTLVQQHRMADTINSLNHQRLEPYSPAVASDLLAKLAEHYRIPWTPADAQRLLAAIRWLQPYYLQLAFNRLRSELYSPGAEMADCIDRVMVWMITPGSDNDFHHWEGRLKEQLGAEDARHAIALLDHAARDDSGARPEFLLDRLAARLPQQSAEEVREKFIALRDILQRDAYWFPDESSGSRRYRFCLEPLRRWWLRRRDL